MSMDFAKILGDGGSVSEFQKAAEVLTTNTFDPEVRSIFTPENLDPIVKLTVPKATPLRNRFPRTRGIGQATAWHRLTSKLHSRSGGTAGIGTNTSISFADAGAPNETAQAFTTQTEAFKLLGRKIELGGLYIAASRGNGAPDAFTQRLRHKMVETMIGEEEMIISGDKGNSALEFDGLLNQITTNSGVASLLTASGVNVYNEAIYNEGGSATLLVVNPRQQRALADELQATGSIQRLMISNQAGVTSQVHLSQIINSVDGGLIDVVTSRYVQNNALLLTERDDAGEAMIEMEDLIPMSRVDVPSSNFSTIAFVLEATVLKVIGEPFQYKITGLAM